MHEQLVDRLVNEHGTPLLLLDLSVLRSNLARFRALFAGYRIFYSTKTNPEPAVIDTLAANGIAFDAATIGEIEYLCGRGIDPTTILYTHPVKSEADIARAARVGVEYFTIDSLEELDVVARLAPEAKISLRLRPSVTASVFDYRGKFGASRDEAKEILDTAAERSISVVGLAFHVGSQSTAVEPWAASLEDCLLLLHKFYERLPALRMLNIGSGFPVPYTEPLAISLEEIAAVIEGYRDRLPTDIELCAEPGRVLVAEAMTLFTRVTGVVTRGDRRWVHTDASVYNGLVEIVETSGRFAYPISSLRSGPTAPSWVSGATLDPDDVIAREVDLPVGLDRNDVLQVSHVGAYVTSFFCEFHRLPRPKIVVVDEGQPVPEVGGS